MLLPASDDWDAAVASLLQVSPHVPQALWSNTVRCYLIFTQETKAELDIFIKVGPKKKKQEKLLMSQTLGLKLRHRQIKRWFLDTQQFSSLLWISECSIYSYFQKHSPVLRGMCESLGHFYLNVCFPEENAASYAAERKQEIERSSVCVLLLKSTVTR